MAAQTNRRDATEETPSTQTVAYWMGKVDANITELKAAFGQFMQKSDSSWAEFTSWRREVDESWAEFAAWRRAVDDRLQSGSNKFDDHHKRLTVLESKQPEKAPAGAVDEKAVFGSWPWFRDNYLEKAVTIVVTLTLYKVIEIIVQNWNLP